MGIAYDTRSSEMLGFYADIKKELVDEIEWRTSREEWEELADVAELLGVLEMWSENEELLAISENNGMGWTIREYKKEAE